MMAGTQLIYDKSFMMYAMCAAVMCFSSALTEQFGWAQGQEIRGQKQQQARRVHELLQQRAMLEAELERLRASEGVSRSVVSGSSFDARPTRHLTESLQVVPGAAVQQGPVGRAIEFSLRGVR